LAKTPKTPKGPKTPPKAEVDKNTDDYGAMFKQMDEPTGTSSPGPVDASDKVKKQKINEVKLADAAKSKREDQKPLPQNSDIERLGDSVKKISTDNQDVQRIRDAVKTDIKDITKQLKKQNEAIVQLRENRVNDFKAVQKAVGEINKQITRLQKGYNDLSGKIEGASREIAKIKSRPVGLPMGHGNGSNHPSEEEENLPQDWWSRTKREIGKNYRRGAMYQTYRGARNAGSAVKSGASGFNNWLKGGPSPKAPAPVPRVPFSNPGAMPQIPGATPEPMAPTPGASNSGSLLGKVTSGVGGMLARGAGALLASPWVVGGAAIVGGGLAAHYINKKTSANWDEIFARKAAKDKAKISPPNLQRNLPGQFSQQSFGAMYHRAQVDDQHAQFMKFGQLPPGFEFLQGHMGRLGSPGAVAARGAQPLSGGYNPGRPSYNGGSSYTPSYTTPTEPQQPAPVVPQPGQQAQPPQPGQPNQPQAPQVPGQPVVGGAAYLAAQRADFKRQIESNPQLKRLLGAVISSENPGAGPAVAESLFNRTAYMNEMRAKQGKAPLSIEQMIVGQPGRSFYGPINRGSINSHLRKMDDPKFAARMHALIEQAYTSNVIKGHTDQGSAGDPNYHQGGIGVNINGERFNDWGLPGTKQWRLKQQREFEAAEQRAREEAAKPKKMDGVIEVPTGKATPGGPQPLTKEQEEKERALDKAAIDKSLRDNPPGMMKLGGPKPVDLKDDRVPNANPGGSGDDAMKNRSSFAGSVLHMSPLTLEKLKEGETRPGSSPRAYGYHTAITPDGQVHELRPYDARPNQIESISGGHRPGAQYLENKNAYGVVLTGDGQLNEKSSAALKQHFASLVARGILPRDYSGYGKDARPTYGHGEIQKDAPGPFQRQTLDKGLPEGGAASKFLNENWNDILKQADALKGSPNTAVPGGPQASDSLKPLEQSAPGISDYIKKLSESKPAVSADGDAPQQPQSVAKPSILGSPVDLNAANRSRAGVIRGQLTVPPVGQFGQQSYPAVTGGWGKGSMPYGYHKLSPQYGASRIEGYLSGTPLSKQDKAQVFNVGKEGRPIDLDDPKYGGNNARSQIQIHGGALTAAKLDKLYSEGCLAIPYDKWGGPNGARAHILQYVKENPTATLAFLPSPKGQPHEFRILTKEQAEIEKRAGNVKVLTPEEAATNFKKNGDVSPPRPGDDPNAPNDGNDPAFDKPVAQPIQKPTGPGPSTGEGPVPPPPDGVQVPPATKKVFGQPLKGSAYNPLNWIERFYGGDKPNAATPTGPEPQPTVPGFEPSPAELPQSIAPMAPDTDKGYAPEKGFVAPENNDPGTAPAEQPVQGPAVSPGTEGPAEAPNFRNNPESAPESPGSGGQGSYGRCFV